ncbi:hypothetical protein [Ruminococcus flavefaciens]|uniref:Uncharacterized protein n=1 Tax=Ruminococcus flavefaciens TaxID=1265 RepID=A0A1M7JH65_RUMFL|nr:hypothetical protein [Ruminococcus flavefaciens]SHM52372.1 hypothetical protein SAMN04487860_1062 [Ruminococcus flavefaciens]
MKHTWKKAAVFTLALALVAGGLPANVGGGGLFGGTAIVANAVETSETVTFSELGYDNQETVESVEAQNCTITFSRGTNSNPPKYYNTGSAIRVYGGNTVTISSTKDISEIRLSFGLSDGTNDITVDTGEYDSGEATWTGNAKSVEFTVGGTKGHRKIASVTVVYNEAATVSKTNISTATVTLAADNSVSSITVGENNITDLSGFDITYGTDDSHTAATPPTAAGKYYAYVTPNSTNTDYEGTAKSAQFIVNGTLADGKYEQYATKDGKNYTRFVFVKPKSEIAGKNKGVFSATLGETTKTFDTTTYYTGVTSNGIHYTVADEDSVMFVVTVSSTGSLDGLTCELDFE